MVGASKLIFMRYKFKLNQSTNQSLRARASHKAFFLHYNNTVHIQAVYKRKNE